MVSSRRQFLTKMAFFSLCPGSLKAYPLTRLLGEPNSFFTQTYIKRFLNWYEKTWSPLQAQMPSSEKQLFHGWLLGLKSFGQELEKGFFVENFLVRHHLLGEEKRHSSYYAGSLHWPANLQKLFEKFFKATLPKNSPLPTEIGSLFGWSHDLDEKKYKFFLKNLDKGQLFPHSPKAPLGFIEFSQKGEQKRATLQMDQNPPSLATLNIDPSTILSAFVITDHQGHSRWKLRTKSTYLLPLKKGVMTLASSHQKEFRQLPDFIDVSRPDEIKLYYP